MSEKSKTEASANPLQALVNRGVDALFKAANASQRSHVGMLLKLYALEGKNTNQDSLNEFNQWEGAQGSKLSQAALQVLFLFKDRYNIGDLLRKHNNSATAAEEIIAHITAKFFKKYGEAQNSSKAIRAAKAAQLGKKQTTKQQDNLFKNISLN